MLPIKGFQKTCLVDFPPYTASTIFLAGCNFKCGYCHNPDIVLHFSDIPDISEEEILDYLSEKKMWIDGVCITGGEPTLHIGLADFCEKIKKLGMLVKIDTNGTNPDMLKELIDKKLVDRIAMDIKTSSDRYDEVAYVQVDMKKIEESIKLIKDYGGEYEFRTTVIPGLVGKKEVFKISKWLEGSKNYAIQNFRGKGVNLINVKMKDIQPYSKEELEEMKKIASDYFEKVEVKD